MKDRFHRLTALSIFMLSIVCLFHSSGPVFAAEGGPGAAATTGEVRTVVIPGITSFDFIRIPAGSFKMGSGLSDPDHSAAEWPEHSVEITNGFWIGKYEVTQDQWESVMKSNPSYFKNKSEDPREYSALDDPTGDTQKYHTDRSNCPVDRVSWNDCQAFAAALSSKEVGLFRLPTEAEWEYACRAGSTAAFYWGDAPDNDYFWNSSNACNKIQQVGLKKPNSWGLYDMSGNVAEWCSDWSEPARDRSVETVRDPKGPEKGEYRIVRGGSWGINASYARSARRTGEKPEEKNMYTGLRLVWEPADGEKK